MEDLKISFTVSETPHEVFEAVTNVRGWWSATLEGESAHQGDEFIYRHGDLHYSRHRLTEVVPDKKVVWLTTDSSINFVDDKTEWTGTTIIFEIGRKDGETTLEFTHYGLVPALACFEACSGGWRYYIESLRQLIVSGEGHPDKKG
ncbi:MAG: SRPBCC domain-containing protein [Mucilaginibacter sp.]|nr:SRPBCC domain-containing protein [Mucilaginibacter sp.]